MNYEQTDVIFVIEKSISLKRYLNELLESYISPAISYFSGGICEENDVFFTQSSLVQYALVFFGSEFSLLGSSTQIETLGPTTSQLSILNAIRDANYSYRNTCRQAYILEGLQTAMEVFKDLSGANYQKDPVKRCLILITQSVPIQNPWATASPESILQDLKQIGVKTSVISAHKLVELYRLFENAGGDQQNLTHKNYSSKPQHLVLLNGFTLQERAISPSLIGQPAVSGGGVNVPTPPTQIGIPSAATGPASNSRPSPSPGQPHTGSPAPQQQQPTQVAMARPAVMNPAPASQAMSTPQVAGTLRANQHMSGNQMINTQSPNVTMNTRQRWPLASGPGLMVQQNTQPVQQQQQQMMPQQNQNPQMGPGNIQQTSCGMTNQPGQINQQMNPSGTAASSIIWQGILEWSEKHVGGGGNALQRIPCKMTSQPANVKPDLKTDNWPSTLQMLLVQKSLLSSVGNTFFQNIHRVMFHPDPCPALESLTNFLSQGYAGCVHLSNSSIEVKMIILLFSPDKRAYVGFIPLDQNAFVAKIKQVFQSQPRNMQAQNTNKNVGGNMMQQGVGGSQVGTGGPQGGVATPNMQMIQNTSGMNVSQSGMIMQQSQMNPAMSQGGMTGNNPMGSGQVSQVGMSQVNQMGAGAQGQTIGLAAQGPQMNIGPHVSQGVPMGNQLGNNQSVLATKLIRQPMNIGGQQPTDQMQMQQTMHATNIRQQMQLQQRPAMQVNLGGQPRMMQTQMRQLLQQQRLQQQQQQQQQQMLMIQQQNMRPQMTQSQQVMGQQVMGQQGMGQQGMGQQSLTQQGIGQQGMAQQGMGQQGLAQGMGQPIQDGSTDYMDLISQVQ